MSDKLLEVKDLRTSFFTHLGEVKAIRGISFDVEKGESIGIVGESGSGKSVTSLSIMKLLLYPGKIVGGEILFNGEDLVNKTNKDMMAIRGNEIAMIFQDPMTSLNPVYTIGDQIAEAIMKHQKLSRKEAHENDSTYLEKLAFLIVKKGLSSVKDFPIGKFGKLITVDRAEIESFRSIKYVMKEYIYSEDYSEQNIKPLSIAVFGAPGSGKSFGVTQVAESIDSERVRKITFNISQFTSTKDLANAFHRVRDVSLEGKIPLVFLMNLIPSLRMKN